MPELSEICDAAIDWPRPGCGQTMDRFTNLAAAARLDVVVGRLVEAHADAVAILAELGGPVVEKEQRWGVWAAGPADSVSGRRRGGDWRLTGAKRWCSGATLLTHALVDAATEDGQRLFAVDLQSGGVNPAPPDWVGPGMARADTRAVSLKSAPARPVGEPGDYLNRPGFWAGAVGVAACWFGGACAVADRIRPPDRIEDPLFLAQLGAVHCALATGRAVLGAAASGIDAAPDGDHRVTAITARSVIERVATEVMDRVGRVLGPGPLAHDAPHAATVADLTVYIRQHHGERDLAELGRAVAASGLVPS